jgi:uncharacterized membrane-anchored protein
MCANELLDHLSCSPPFVSRQHALSRKADKRTIASREAVFQMKFDNQNRQSVIEALAGSIRLKARLRRAITGLVVKFH